MEPVTAVDLNKGKGFTQYNQPILSTQELISAIKRKLPTKLYIYGDSNKSPVRIEDTVKPLEVVVGDFEFKGDRIIRKFD